MFGIRFIKTQPTTFLIQFKSGRSVREGPGLSFFYYAPTTSLVAVPLESTEAPFMFEERTADFQTVTIQGQLTYRIADPRKIAGLMNFAIDPGTKKHISEDPQRLGFRMLNTMQVQVHAMIQQMPLRDALGATTALADTVRSGLRAATEVAALGVEVLGLAIVAIKPTPETARALEAETREALLKKADESTYARRNAAVEQERAIKENELNTEIAVENKQRQIREAKMDADRAIQDKQQDLERARLAAQIDQETLRKSFVAAAAENSRTESEARAYGMRTLFESMSQIDSKVLQVLAQTGMNPEQLISAAFQEMAGRADKIGELNISPDLLRELMKKR